MPHESFTGFYQRYYRLVLTIAHQRLGSFWDAEDATAEVFRIAWRQHQAGVTPTLPWLYQVLRNVVGNEYRRRDRTDTHTRRLDDSDDPAPSVARDDVIDLRRRLAQLPEPDRELLYMAYWEDLSRAEIGQILGCSAATVRVRLLRARSKLRAALDGATPTQRKESLNGRP